MYLNKKYILKDLAVGFWTFKYKLPVLTELSCHRLIFIGCEYIDSGKTKCIIKDLLQLHRQSLRVKHQKLLFSLTFWVVHCFPGS